MLTFMCIICPAYSIVLISYKRLGKADSLITHAVLWASEKTLIIFYKINLGDVQIFKLKKLSLKGL